MKNKLVWPATLLASFALGAACSGGTTDDGMGGEGGTDGSTGGSGGTDTGGSGGTAEGGGDGLGGLGGKGPLVITPLTCSDGLENEDETDVDCGGPDCDPCAAGDACLQPSDCASGVCFDGACLEAECGDGVVNQDSEDCDYGRETHDCNPDCTFTTCGDGYVNSQAEQCEPDPDLDIWQRCGRSCIYGVDLDGTWRTSDLPGTDSPWERLTPRVVAYGYYTYPIGLAALPSFHYLGQGTIYDFHSGGQYDIAADAWSDLDQAAPFGTYWANGAVDSEAIWVPRAGTMYRFDVASETWTDLAIPVPNGSTEYTAAVYDGDGFIWYAGGADNLVKYDPNEGTFVEVPYAPDYAGWEVFETRVAYDPVTNRILLTGYTNDTFLIYDLASETFSTSTASPYGTVRDNACQDRAGGVYIGSNSNPLYMYRYDVAADEYAQLPELPVPHDDYSTCVVSEVGYLYYASEGAFARLRLNHY